MIVVRTSAIVQSTYPDLLQKMNDPSFFHDRAILAPKHFQQFSAIVQSTHPNMLQNMHNSSFFQDGAILAPNNVIVDAMNNYLLDLIPKKKRLI
jgi:hypothetical protein